VCHMGLRPEAELMPNAGANKAVKVTGQSWEN